jgi:hypothetical protein
MNSRVDPDVILGPLSEMANRIGRLGLLMLRSTSPSARASTLGTRPSACRASVKTISIWVEVSSAETMSASHLRDARSSTTLAAISARGK